LNYFNAGIAMIAQLATPKDPLCGFTTGSRLTHPTPSYDNASLEAFVF